MKLEEACDKAIEYNKEYVYISNDNEVEVSINTKTKRLEVLSILSIDDIKDNSWEIVK